MTLMNIRLELGRTSDRPEGDRRHGYEFVAPLDANGHLDAAAWASAKQHCTVRSFRPGHEDRTGMLRHLGQGWRFDYEPGRDDDEPFFKLDRHTLAPGLYVTLTEDGRQLPFRIVSVSPVTVPA